MKKRQENQRFPSFLILKKSRKGTHVGVVLSFVIFVTFLVFLYSIIQPAIKTRANEQNLLNFLEDNLVSQVSADMTTVSIGVNKVFTHSCIELNDVINETEITTNFIVINDSGYVFDSLISIDAGNNYDLFIDRPRDELDNFFKIRVSEEFGGMSTGTMGSCKQMDKDANGYTVGSIRTDKYIFESKIKELMESYGGDYGGTKKALNVSAQNEFGFGFTYSNGTTIKTPEVDVSTVIYADEVPIQYIDEDANIESGRLNIKLW